MHFLENSANWPAKLDFFYRVLTENDFRKLNFNFNELHTFFVFRTINAKCQNTVQKSLTLYSENHGFWI